MLNKFLNIKISAMSVVVPEREINIYDEAQYYGNNIKRIDRMRKMVGFWKRRVSDRSVAPTYYAIDAAERVFEEMNIDRTSIDALVYMAQRQDWSQPATAFYIHQKLGLDKSCPVLTINHGCAAWAYGMWTCSQMIASGANKRVLLLCADVPSVGIDPSNRVSAPVFGDAGSATLLEYAEDAEPIYFNSESYTEGFEAIITPISGAHCIIYPSVPSDDKLFNDLINNPVQTPSGHKLSLFGGYMDGIAVFDFTIQKVPANIKSLMEYAGVVERDIDTLCLHQANKQIIQAVAAEAGFPIEKAPYYAFENYGNNSMNTIPTTLNTVIKNKMGSNKTKLLCSAFGNGLTVCSLLITLDTSTKLCGVFNWRKPDWFMTRDQYITYWINKISANKL